MANFCKYCGKALVNDLCDCQEFQAAQAQRATREQAAAQQTASMEGAQGSGMNGGLILRELQGIWQGFFKDPYKTAGQAYRSQNHISQYLTALVYALVILFSVCIIFASSGLEGGFKTGFMTALICVAVKAVYAGIVFLFAKKNDPACDIQKVFGLFCVMTIPESVLILVLMILGALDLYTCMVIIMIFNAAVMTASNVLATLLAMKGNMKKAYVVTLIASVIIIALSVVIGKSVVVHMIKSAMGSMLGGLGRFY